MSEVILLSFCMRLHTLKFEHELFSDQFVVNNNCILIISFFSALRKVIGTKYDNFFVDDKNLMMHLASIAIDSYIQIRLLHGEEGD